MSRKHKKAPFDGQSQIYESYYQRLRDTQSKETYSIVDPGEDDDRGTVSPVKDGEIPKTTRPEKDWSKVRGILSIVAGLITIGLLIYSICSFFGRMNTTIVDTKQTLLNVQQEIKDTEESLVDFKAELNTSYNNIDKTLGAILSKFDRVFDRLPIVRNNGTEDNFLEDKHCQ